MKLSSKLISFLCMIFCLTTNRKYDIMHIDCYRKDKNMKNRLCSLLSKIFEEFNKKVRGIVDVRLDFDKILAKKLPRFKCSECYSSGNGYEPTDGYNRIYVNFEPMKGYGIVGSYLMFEDDGRYVIAEGQSSEDCLKACRKVVEEFGTKVVVYVPANYRRFVGGKSKIVVFSKEDFLQ